MANKCICQYNDNESPKGGSGTNLCNVVHIKHASDKISHIYSIPERVSQISHSHLLFP
jgi:hypothetical protein